ncbi:MAG TPA: AI-2E family transporter [Pseudomonadota bacterium]|nr:AI-2E family transporter [Pseudomonadota bacterium]
MFDDRRLSLLLFRVLCYVVLLVIAYSVLSRLSLVLTPVSVALVLAFLLNPSVSALEERKVPRWLAVGLMLLFLLGVLTAVGVTIPYLVRSEIERFSAQLPSYQGLIDRKVLPLLGKVFKYRATSIGDWLKLLTNQVTEWVRGAMGQISDALGTAILSVAGLFKYLVAGLLIPVFTVSFLMDMPAIGENLKVLVPPRHKQLVVDIMDDIYGALGSWLRGQLTVMLIQAALYSIGLSIAGIPLAIFIGCTAGLLAFVPYVGVMIGLCSALLVALLEVSTAGATPILGVLATFGAVQLLDALVITPRAVGGRIGLSAVGVIFALSLGGSLLGYAGLLLAVPFAAVFKALLPRLKDAYTGTAFYRGEAVADPVAAKTSQSE